MFWALRHASTTWCKIFPPRESNWMVNYLRRIIFINVCWWWLRPSSIFAFHACPVLFTIPSPRLWADRAQLLWLGGQHFQAQRIIFLNHRPQYHQLTKSNEEIYVSFARCVRNATIRQEGGAYRHLISAPILQLEFTPFINRIISPPLRPVSDSFCPAKFPATDVSK